MTVLAKIPIIAGLGMGEVLSFITINATKTLTVIGLGLDVAGNWFVLSAFFSLSKSHDIERRESEGSVTDISAEKLVKLSDARHKEVRGAWRKNS